MPHLPPRSDMDVLHSRDLAVYHRVEAECGYYRLPATKLLLRQFFVGIALEALAKLLQFHASIETTSFSFALRTFAYKQVRLTRLTGYEPQGHSLNYLLTLRRPFGGLWLPTWTKFKLFPSPKRRSRPPGVLVQSTTWTAGSKLPAACLGPI